MANTLTNLFTDAYAALNVVSRELTGFIPAVQMDASAERIAAGQTLRSPIAPAATLEDATPAMAFPTASDQTFTNRTLTMGTPRRAKFSWTGEEQMSLNNGGAGYLTLRQNQIAEGFRALANEIDQSIFAAARVAGSRAVGTAGTTPFASTLEGTAEAGRILNEAGAPQSGRQLVISGLAASKLRTLGQLTKANEAGDTSLLRQGTLLDINSFAIRESASVGSITVGTASGATTNNAGYAVGATTLTLASAGTGTLIAGDVVTFAGDTNQYIIKTGDADVSGGGTIVLESPGLRVAMSAATKAITVVAAATRNIAFTRSAIVLATRVPMMPTEGDLAIANEIVTDERTGLSFDIRIYPGVGMVTGTINIISGVAVFNPSHVSHLLG